ncbi:hypothetical protein AB6A40_010128 [Gnathostoma spinigerum]|uniref:Little elongation complex subunit 2 C-terminal domain-containing protein n=1 Tax=Gnathostoma spinigerum TaxID=75299 RepID=A0ABD6F0Y1_9BILA
MYRFSVLDRVDKICIVGKPCPCDSLNPITLWRRFVKYALKSSIQLKRKIGSGKGGRQRTKTSKLRSVESGTSKTRGDETMEGDKESQNEGDHSPLDNLAIATDDENEIGSPKQTSTNAQFIRNSASNSTDDLLGSIMSGMGAADHAESLETSRLSADDLSHYNGANLAKRYSIFTFGHDGTQDVDVLIRSNNDGVDAGCNICVSHKVEYAPHLGAERLSEEEWLRDCFRCLFKGASELLRLRIHYCDGDLLQKERYRLTSLMKDESRRKVISDRTKRMRSAILNLESLEVGSYVLTFDDSRKMHILSTKENRDSMVNIDAENLKNIKENPTLPSCKTFFQGIDEHLVLVYHIIQKRIPAAFMPAYDTNKGGLPTGLL